MKKLVLTVAMFLTILAAQAKGEKVKILHDGKVIEISVNALEAHLAHGDEVLVLYNDEWITESEYNNIHLAALEKDYEEVTADSADAEGEEENEEE